MILNLHLVLDCDSLVSIFLKFEGMEKTGKANEPKISDQIARSGARNHAFKI